MCRMTEPAKLVAVTNRRLCHGDFLAQVERLCVGGVDRIILREKDLSEKDYEQLARQVLEVCRTHNTECILHTYPSVAEKLGADGIHLPLPVAKSYRKQQQILQHKVPGSVGISIHSREEALQAAQLGATYLTAGHIFATACKPDVAPRGLAFLDKIVKSVAIPVYAIGGINAENAGEVLAQEAAGICIMSGFMNATDRQIAEYRNCTILRK